VRLFEAPGVAAAGEGDLRVRIVQPSVPQSEKWRPENRAWIWDRLLSLTAARGEDEGQRVLVVWPESAVPFVLSRNETALAEIGETLGPDRMLVTGANRLAGAGSSLEAFNSVHVVNGEGTILATYDKHHLVPFGEYLPFRPLLEAIGLEKLTEGIGFSAGRGLQTLVVPGLPAIGPLVCYEAIFPVAVTDPRRRPDVLVNLTDDSWFGPFAGPRQHLAIARMRAIEEGLPLVRAANSGISIVADPRGRVIGRLGVGEIGTIGVALPAATAPTPYARLGDLVFLGLLLAAALWARYSEAGRIF
ncbi:MAG: apolipoprotein N-acyltransferase, partial [Alphaproteobacteria bacterium]|nr:apolipoprotein N-acyltransferase [Alphaproteobacteria bacterium]